MRLFLPLLFLLAITGPAHSDQPVIRWYGFDWAPGYITEGPLKGQGFADEMQAIVQENLPGFTHENLWVSLPRADRAIRIEDNACFTPGFHEWRDPAGKIRKDIIWSVPLFLFYWHGLVVLREKRDEYGPDWQVSLESELNNGTRILGLQKGQSYGPFLDPILADHQDSDRILRRASGAEALAGQYRLLLRGRVDALLDYLPMKRYAERLLGNSRAFAFLPIREHEGRFGLGAVVCNNSDEGRAFITALNQAIAEKRDQAPIRSLNERWFMIEGQEAEYRDLWQKELLAR